MSSRIIKHTLVVLLILTLSTLIIIYGDNTRVILWVFSLIIIVFGILNSSFRKSLKYKNYFAHPLNFLTTKYRREKSYDLPKELMFEKVIEVIKTSKFKLIEADSNALEILALSDFSYKSWGENIYIQFEDDEYGALLKFCSVTVLQLYSWGKNEDNFTALLDDIDRSFII